MMKRLNIVSATISALALQACIFGSNDSGSKPLDDGAAIACKPSLREVTPGELVQFQVETAAAKRENRIATVSASGGRVTLVSTTDTLFWDWRAPLDEGEYILTAQVVAKPEITAECIFRVSRSNQLDIDTSLPNLPFRLAFRPDAREVALLDENGRVLLFESATNRFSSYVVSEKPNAQSGLAYDNDMSDIVVAGANGKLAFIDVRSGRWYAMSSNTLGTPNAVAFDPEGTAWICTDRCLAKANAEGSSCVLPSPCSAVSLGAGGGIVYAAGIGTLAANTGEILRTDPLVGRMSFDGQFVARPLANANRVEIASASSGAVIRTHEAPFAIGKLAIAPRGDLLVVSTADLNASSTYCVFRSDAAPVRCFETEIFPSNEPRREVLDMAFSPDGTRFATIERKGSDGRSFTNWELARLLSE